MHAKFHVGGAAIMASDGRCTGKPDFQGFALSIEAAGTAEAEKKFKALAEGGQVHMPLAKTFWAKLFGMVADRFGVLWMIAVEQ
jgi:PhnB protein